MFEDRTQENILQELLELVPSDANTNEGSLIYATLAAAAEKLEDAYIDIETVYDNSFADTCDREHLIRRAAERGLAPAEATSAVYKAEFNCEMSVNDRFSKGDYNFILTGVIEGYTYYAKCETAGACGNNSIGTFDSFLGYNEMYNNEGTMTELLIPGEDEEDTKIFRQRYFDSVASKEFAGNVPAYINFINDLNGVGSTKIIPCADGPGTVKCIVMNSLFRKPTQELINSIQNMIDPATDANNYGSEYGLPVLQEYKAMGYGLAPINHNVTIVGVLEETIKVVLSLELEDGYELEDVEDSINAAIDDYFMELAKAWGSSRTTTVRKTYIESRILNLNGIVDIQSATVNGEDAVVLEIDRIPVRGDVTCQSS